MPRTRRSASPAAGCGTLGCNASFRRNIGVEPLAVDLGTVPAEELRDRLALDDRPVVLSACAPCTGFSRMLAHNHVVDDVRNSLVVRVAAFARVLRPEVIVMENARELLMGRFAGHFGALRERLEEMGYRVVPEIHFLSDFGLPQRRERALIVAVREGLPALGLSDLWSGLSVRAGATTVRRAISHLPAVPAGIAHASDPMHVSPRVMSAVNKRRVAAIPHDGGSWFDLISHPDADELLTPSMKHRAAIRDFGSHPDVYGRLSWDQPAATSNGSAATSGTAGTRTPSRTASARCARWRSCRASRTTTSSCRRRSRICTVTSATRFRRSSPTRSQRSSPGSSGRPARPRGHGAAGMQPDSRGHHREVAAPIDERSLRDMRAQRERDTGIERAIRSHLHARGLRFRVHRRLLSGSRREVDVVFPGARVAVFVDGCFWHGCPEHGTWPRNNAEFWRRKIEANVDRDRDTNARLAAEGWTVVRVWEHESPAEAAARIADAVDRRRA